MFWKKKKVDKTQETKIILGMVMLQDEISFELDSLIKDYNNNSDNKIQETTGDNSSLILIIDDETIAIGHVEVPIPSGDIEGTAQYAYNWQSAVEDTKEHKSHLIVSVIQG